MTAHAKIELPKMTVAEFRRWEAAQPEDARYELVAGVVVRMQSERVRHTVVKFNVARALRDAVRAADVPCRVFTDGVSVDMPGDYTYKPDASVQCGGSIDLDATTIDAPMIIVEVASPSTARADIVFKVGDYFNLPSVMQVLIIEPVLKRIARYTRTPTGAAEVHIFNVGDTVQLDPPGLHIAVASVFDEL